MFRFVLGTVLGTVLQRVLFCIIRRVHEQHKEVDVKNGNDQQPEIERRDTFIDALIREIEEAADPGPKTSTFTIRITEGDQHLLQNLADQFNWKKTPFAQVLLSEALQEGARKLALYQANGNREKAARIYFDLLRPSAEASKGVPVDGEGS